MILIDKEQVAKLFDITQKSLDLWIKTKFGPKPIRIDNLIRFDRSEVETFANELTPKVSDPTLPIKKYKK